MHFTYLVSFYIEIIYPSNLFQTIRRGTWELTQNTDDSHKQVEPFFACSKYNAFDYILTTFWITSLVACSTNLHINYQSSADHNGPNYPYRRPNNTGMVLQILACSIISWSSPAHINDMGPGVYICHVQVQNFAINVEMNTTI